MPDTAVGKMLHLMEQQQEQRRMQLQASRDIAAALTRIAEVCFSDLLCLYVQQPRK